MKIVHIACEKGVWRGACFWDAAVSVAGNRKMWYNHKSEQASFLCEFCLTMKLYHKKGVPVRVFYLSVVFGVLRPSSQQQINATVFVPRPRPPAKPASGLAGIGVSRKPIREVLQGGASFVSRLSSPVFRLSSSVSRNYRDSGFVLHGTSYPLVPVILRVVAE